MSAPPSRLRAGLAERGIGLEEELGRGGTSIVYRATDRKHARPVVVKVLRPEVSAALGTIRFLREIQFAAVLRHPHILPLYDSGAVDGSLFYVMPYVDGESLRQRLARSGRLPIEEALRIAGEVAGALAHAHAQGIVHRDIKPENILLEAGHAVVADFGVGLAMTRAARDRASAEESGGEPLTAVGTPAYMSPEQASGDAAVDGRSDIYSLGCVVYEMLTGEPPFTGPTTRATIARRFQGPPVPVRQLRPNVPAAVAAAVEQALAFEPSERFATVMDFAQALAAPARRDPLSLGRIARRIAAVTGPLALGAVVLLATQLPGRRMTRPGLNPRRVAVAAPSNETGDSTLSPLGSMVASWITDRLSRSSRRQRSGRSRPAPHAGPGNPGRHAGVGLLLSRRERDGGVPHGDHRRELGPAAARHRSRRKPRRAGADGRRAEPVHRRRHRHADGTVSLRRPASTARNVKWFDSAPGHLEVTRGGEILAS